MTGKRIAAASLGALALVSAAAAAQTQDPNTVGNPQLKNFELPGTTTVPAPEPAPPTTTPAPTPAPTPPPTAEPRPETPAPAATPPRPEAAAPERRAPARPPAAAAPPAPAAAAPAPVPAPAAPLPAPTDLQEPLPLPPAPAAPPMAAPAPEAPVAQEPAESFPWQYAGFALLLGLLAFFGYRRSRRLSRKVEQFPPEPETAAGPMPAAAPIPAAAPAPEARTEPRQEPAADAGVIGVTLRPWLEIEFRPDRAAATLTDASVQFELILRNVGNAPARNIRIESAIFSAGPDQEREIADWYAEPIRERTAPALPLLAPREEVATRSVVTIPKDHVREIEIGGRKLFIPTVAFNIAYDWGANRQGQTSVSYVVGREAETPSEKMGAFRLDLGPRLYRSVGQRQTPLARIV